MSIRLCAQSPFHEAFRIETGISALKLIHKKTVSLKLLPEETYFHLSPLHAVNETAKRKFQHEHIIAVANVSLLKLDSNYIQIRVKDGTRYVHYHKDNIPLSAVNLHSIGMWNNDVLKWENVSEMNDINYDDGIRDNGFCDSIYCCKLP